MGEFPSGHRGQTVNLLLLASVVRIHLLPPKSSQTSAGFFCFVGLSIILDTIIKKFDRRKPFEGTHRTVVGST